MPYNGPKAIILLHAKHERERVMKTDGKSIFFTKEEIPEPTEEDIKFIEEHESLHALHSSEWMDVVEAIMHVAVYRPTLH